LTVRRKIPRILLHSGPMERSQSLRAALQVLYTPGDAVSISDRSGADAFLQAFLFSPDCWQLSLNLIRSPDAAFFEQLFCARALHQRLRCSVIKSVQTQASHQVPAAAILDPHVTCRLPWPDTDDLLWDARARVCRSSPQKSGRNAARP
jgi:hypothetical protein